MPRSTVRPALLAPLVAALLAVGLVAAGPPSGAAAPTREGSGGASGDSQAAPLRYVALGDSYSSAAGIQPYVVDAPAECQRSTLNYPHLIAEQIGASLTDVTCSGARTRDYRKSQGEGIAPQLEALSPRTQLVTQTIGGNDGGVFADSIQQCGTAAATTGGQGSPCKDQYGSQFVDKIREKTYPHVLGALRRVHKAAPNARVAILGYPRILPPTDGCFPQMPVATGDVPYLRNLQTVLNNVIRRAAAQTGTAYVNLDKASEGHDACQAQGVRWIEPVFGGTNPVVVHPNELGEQKLALRTLLRLNLD